MQLWCWSKKKEPITVDKVINYACCISYNMLMADVYGYSNDFINYGGWYFKYETSFSENYNMQLTIEIKHSLDKITYNLSNSQQDDCVVCTETTKDFIDCCKQPICKECLKKIQKHNPGNFCCPMCRKDLNSLSTKYTLTKEEVKKRIKIS